MWVNITDIKEHCVWIWHNFNENIKKKLMEYMCCRWHYVPLSLSGHLELRSAQVRPSTQRVLLPPEKAAGCWGISGQKHLPQVLLSFWINSFFFLCRIFLWCFSPAFSIGTKPFRNYKSTSGVLQMTWCFISSYSVAITQAMTMSLERISLCLAFCGLQDFSLSGWR